MDYGGPLDKITEFFAFQLLFAVGLWVSSLSLGPLPHDNKGKGTTQLTAQELARPSPALTVEQALFWGSRRLLLAQPGWAQGDP